VIALDADPNRDLALQEQFITDSVGSDGGSTAAGLTFAEAMRQLGVEVRAADLENAALPFASGSIDAVVLTEVIEHLWHNPLLALSEANRVLKDGTGVLLISTPNFLSLRNRVNLLRGQIEHAIEHPAIAYLKKLRLGHLGHVRLYAPTELESMLKLLGFESRFHYRSFDYWAPGASEDLTADADAGGSGTPAPHVPRKSLFRRLIRSPRGYLDAAVATTGTMIERAAPTLRSHMFVIATKKRNVDYTSLSTAEVSEVIGQFSG
jgi:SAM-dependent methyltransferase